MKNNRALTSEQQKLVEDNHSLIYQFLHKLNLDIEEFYGIAAIGLCKAAMSYGTSNKVVFSTYAHHVMHAEIKNEFIRLNAQKRTGDTVSLDELVPGAIDLTVGETLYGADTPHTVAVANEILEAIDILPIKQRKALKSSLQGYSAKEAYKFCDSTPKGVSMLITSARKTLRANGFA
jgi:RNA polymerase sigma factor (sigma-70 family)